MRFKKLVAFVVCVVVAVGLLGGCAERQAHDVSPETIAEPYSVGTMKGATSIGMAALMQDQQELEEQGSAPVYDFTVAASADELVPQVAAGDMDFALVPANLAAKLYEQTDGAIQVIGINTLGVLYGVSYDANVSSIADLAGRTVYMTGKGSVPGYTVESLLARAGVADQVTIEFKSEPAEALAALQNDRGAVAIVPEPFVTASLVKDSDLVRALDLTALWDESIAGANAGGRFVTGVTVARTQLINEDPQAVSDFLSASMESVDAALEEPAAIADTLVDLGILGNAQLASIAVPKCNVVCITGEEMKEDLSGYLDALFSVEATSVGGTLPDEGFYYTGV